MPRLSKIGAAALAAFGWSSGTSGVTASYLVVAGGGAGGNGGGGAGGLLTGTTSLNPTQSYTVTVGAGGANATYPTVGSSGGASSISGVGISAAGGGAAAQASFAGLSGGSGGGGAGSSYGSGAAGSGNTPSTSPSQGNNGGTAGTGTTGSSGGGGAGAVGGNGSGGTGGAGGAGTASSISGSSVTYGGGGGAGGDTAGAGGAGGGGAGASGNNNGTSGTASTGGGGGGTRNNTIIATNGNGGSGIVIISYAGAQQFGGGVVTSVGGNTIHTFTTSGTLSPITSLSASYLVVGGGGGGSFNTITGGGAGSGGTFSGSGLTIDPNSTYLVTVGAGGAKATNNAFGEKGTAGGISSFLSYVTTAPTYPSTGNSGTSGNGYAGGTNAGNGAGGGGGASAVGGNASAGQGGSGGVGITSSISGTSTQYAGGGSGGSDTSSQTAAIYNGGIGASNAANGVDAPANYGGGGGGGRSGFFSGGYYAASNGGSGVVIISYPGSTAQMSGGTVTIVGGNVIHTFTSSGFLSPIVLLNRSLRFRSSASAYLNRTPATASNRKTWTWSGWVKRGTLSSALRMFQASPTSFLFQADATLLVDSDGGSNYCYTSAVFRDPAAWYHIVITFDTTQATSTNRIRIYVNGIQQAVTFVGAVTLNYDGGVNAASIHYMGANNGSGQFFDGYMADVNFIDGQALTPSSFGSFNAYGSWSPVRYGGSYGTNGFYLPFTNNASTTTLGLDFSPNGNNWTTNNISLTAGSTYDSMTDVPTLTSATAANYCVINPLDGGSSAAMTISDGNLKATAGTGWFSQACTIGVTSGKFYWEQTIGTGSFWYAGIIIGQANWSGSGFGQMSNGYSYYSSGQKQSNSIAVSYGSSYTTGDVIGVALDMDAGTITFYKNNTSQGIAYTGLTGVARPAVSSYNSGVLTANFGQRPFTYTPPSGFVALNTFNL